MDKDVLHSIVEFILNLVIEGVLVGFIFLWISNKSQDKSHQNLKDEMNTIETQNRHNTEQIIQELKEIKSELISQIKETGGKAK